MQVKIKKLHPDAKIPAYAKPGDAGVDLTAVSYEFKNGRHVYDTGLAFEIPPGHVGLLFPRSSICKKDLRLTNSVGVLDSSYRGSVKFIFENDAMYGLKEFKLPYNEALDTYAVGDRVGQLIILPYPVIEFEESSDLTETERGTGGFGHTGK